MTDEEIKATIEKILLKLQDPKTGWNSRREELRRKYKGNEYARAKQELLFKVAKERAETRGVSFDDMDDNDITFSLTGEDVVEKYFINSCNQVAKGFCYMHDKMVKAGEIKPLDLQIMMSTDMDYLVSAQFGHALPCVKMSDGKYHAFDPQIQLSKGHPDVQFINSEIKVGNTIYHLLEQIKGKPYKIMAIMSWKEYENNISNFANFLKVATEKDKKTSMNISSIQNVLKGLNLQNGIRANIYNFCHEMQNTKSRIRIVMADKKGSKNPFFTITIRINGDLYYFMPNSHNYVFLHKLKDLGNNKFLDIGSEHQDEYTLAQEFTPKEYIKWFESNVMNKNRERY